MKDKQVTEVGALELGMDVDDAIRSAVHRARETDTEVRFDFNRVQMRVRGDSEFHLLRRDFSRGVSGYHDDPVGPYPPRSLSPETMRRDADKEEQKQKAREKARQEREAKRAKEREAFRRETEGVKFALADAEAWEEFKQINDDPYGAGVVKYAEAWARLMQARMAEGAAFEDVAKEASHDADTEGITGFMYGCAVQVLSEVWEHGERLRRWHNSDTQIGTEGDEATESGGVLNPAILSAK